MLGSSCFPFRTLFRIITYLTFCVRDQLSLVLETACSWETKLCRAPRVGQGRVSSQIWLCHMAGGKFRPPGCMLSQTNNS